jgi:hypothetical protein
MANAIERAICLGSNRPPVRSRVALPQTVPSIRSTTRSSSVRPNGLKISRNRGPIELAFGRQAEDRVVVASSDQGVVGGRLVVGELAPEEMGLVLRILLGSGHRERREQTRRRVVRRPRGDHKRDIDRQVLIDVERADRGRGPPVRPESPRGRPPRARGDRRGLRREQVGHLRKSSSF